MSSRKISKCHVGEETKTLRRSNRINVRKVADVLPKPIRRCRGVNRNIRRKVADVLPEPIRRCRGVTRKRKKVSKQVEEEEEEQQLTVESSIAERSSFPEPPLTRTTMTSEENADALPLTSLGDHQMPKGQTGVPVVEVSSPEEEKPSRDILFMLQHEMKPNSKEELLPEDRQHLENAATVLKSQLVSRLTSSSDILRTNDMVVLANRCYSALRELGDNYKSFSTEVNKMIAQHQELAFAAKERENWTDWELKTRYIQQVELLSDASERFVTAQDDLYRSQNKVEYMKLQKEKLEAAIHVLEDELSEEEERIKALKTEHDRSKNTYTQIELEVEKLDAENREASAQFEAINGRYNTAKEEFKRMCDHLQQSRSPMQDSINFSPSNQATAPLAARSPSAESTPSPSTASP